jgi:hypothetical protein
MFSSNASSAAGDVNYIEDVFSTYLYTGNGSTQTITNGIDLAGEGGLVWIKSRTNIASHELVDTVRGANKRLESNTTGAESAASDLAAFNSNGFNLQFLTGQGNSSGQQYVSWTFRKQPKFFDVVTYTGNGVAGLRSFAHSLASVPGFIIIKDCTNVNPWIIYHRSITAGNNMEFSTGTTFANGYFATAPTSSVFSVDSTTSTATTNVNGATYVAYLFAHDAGGFGLTGTDNVISCGSFTTDGNGTIPETALGYEPQWVMFKAASTTGSWTMNDTMRGQPTPTTTNGSAPAATLYANNANAESQADNLFPTATGFKGVFAAVVPSTTYIYIAIRRGPMKVPTTGTSVFTPTATSAATGTAITTSFPGDMQLYKTRGSIDYWFDVDRLRGVNSTTTGNSTPWLDTTATTAEATATNVSRNWGNTGFEVPGIVGGAANIFYSFGRAPGFFDEVCYTGTGSQQNITHNLGVAPELLIVKRRSAAGGSWATWATSLTADQSLALNTTDDKTAVFSVGFWGSTFPASSVFTVGSNVNTNSNTVTYVAYLFATCPGVSKVGSYTGNGSSQTINCGFTGGARFVMIKRTDSTGDWVLWDSSRGMVAGDDPYLLLNSTAAEVTNTDYIDTFSAGFEISSTAPAAINANGGTFVFLAIA